MFADQAEAALDFYSSVFPDAKVINTMPGPDGSVAGGTFELAGLRFTCYNAGHHPDFSPSQFISLMITADTQEEIDHYYEKLSEGGRQQPCGWLADKFGVSWQVTPTRLLELLSDPDREKAGRVTQAMFAMKKIILADLEQAAVGE